MSPSGSRRVLSSHTVGECGGRRRRLPRMEGAGALSSMGRRMPERAWSDSPSGVGDRRRRDAPRAVAARSCPPGARLGGLADAVLEILGRCKALRRRPGLGREPGTQREIPPTHRRVTRAGRRDADALAALGDADAARSVIAGDARCTGRSCSPPMMASTTASWRGARARSLRCRPPPGSGHRRGGPGEGAPHRSGLPMADDGLDCSWLGPAALAGDRRHRRRAVGIIGALLARGVEHPGRPHSAPRPWAGGRARQQRGLVAGDLPPLVARWLSRSSDPANLAPVDRQYLGQQNRSNGG